jgi:hypothetical protein
MLETRCKQRLNRRLPLRGESNVERTGVAMVSILGINVLLEVLRNMVVLQSLVPLMGVLPSPSIISDDSGDLIMIVLWSNSPA